jgi:hypothetical protein
MASLFCFYELDIANAISDVLNDSTRTDSYLVILRTYARRMPLFCYWMYAGAVLVGS